MASGRMPRLPAPEGHREAAKQQKSSTSSSSGRLSLVLLLELLVLCSLRWQSTLEKLDG